MSEETLAIETQGKTMHTSVTETAVLSGQMLTTGPDKNTFYIRHDSF
jgi:hypothetical protein